MGIVYFIILIELHQHTQKIIAVLGTILDNIFRDVRLWHAQSGRGRPLMICFGAGDVTLLAKEDMFLALRLVVMIQAQQL